MNPTSDSPKPSSRPASAIPGTDTATDAARPPLWGALIVAAVGGVVFVVDGIVTRLRLKDAHEHLRRDARGGRQPHESLQRIAQIADDYDLRTAVVGIAAGVIAAVLLLIGAHRHAPARAAGLARRVGVGVASWCLLSLLFIALAVSADDVSYRVPVITTVIGVIAVLVIVLDARRRAGHADERRAVALPWTRPQLGVAVAGGALLLAAVILAAVGRDTDVCTANPETTLLSVATVLAVAAGVVGILLIVLRRWLLGLSLAIVAGGAAFLFLLAHGCWN